jgi:hypothetical protein
MLKVTARSRRVVVVVVVVVVLAAAAARIITAQSSDAGSGERRAVFILEFGEFAPALAAWK